jgi:5-methyltetrahydropteroyltriglutamate--homocysteine methyltransferase
MHFLRFSDFADRAAFAGADQFFVDLIAVFRQEIADWCRAGCRMSRSTRSPLPLLCDGGIRRQGRAGGGDPDALVEPLHRRHQNGAIAACPPEVVVGVQLCRGNFKGHHLADGGYESVAERFFAGTPRQPPSCSNTIRRGPATSRRCASSRRGREVVLGLVSSKTPALESIDLLRRRTDEAARHIRPRPARDQPAMRLRQQRRGNPLSEADERAKLGRVVEAAQAIWR